MPHALLVAALRAERRVNSGRFRRRSRPTRSVFTFLGHAPRRRGGMRDSVLSRRMVRRWVVVVVAAAALPASMPVLAARGESPAAFGRRCIPSGCVAPSSNIPDILGRRALPAGRIAALGATPDFHHGLVTKIRLKPPSDGRGSPNGEPSLLGGRCAAAKTASKAAPAKTCFISREHGFRRCLVSPGARTQDSNQTARQPVATNRATVVAPSDPPDGALLKRYCVSCHNRQANVAGIALDTIALDDIPAGAAVW